VRRSREEADRTRREAVDAASRLFRERGLDAVSVADVMAEIGMTAGGFYRHFDSKDALAAEACAAAFAGSALAVQPARSARALLGRYLGKEHRDHPAAGCPIPALVSEIPRQPPEVRQAYTAGVREALQRIEELAPAADAKALLAGMVGALALARAVDDEQLSDAILRDTRAHWSGALEERS
jgi:TetR/AcrR family transcriptional regulator, transcriptional repressor for nem operon